MKRFAFLSNTQSLFPPSNEIHDQLDFLSFSAVITTNNNVLSKDELASHILGHWPHTQDWEVFWLSDCKFLVKFPSLSLRDKALNTN